MGSEWKEYELSEFIGIKHGFAFKGEFFKGESTTDYLLTPGNFSIGGGFKGDKFKFYEGPVPEEYILQKGDLVVTMTDLSKEADTLGYSALVPEIAGHRLLHNQRVGLVEFKNDELDKIYLYFLLRSREYRHHVISSVTGTTVKHTSPTKILSYRFRKPSKSVQIEIGRYLLEIEKKAELNRQTNQTLEQMAQALFKSWFVDFDPVIDNALAAGKPIPEELQARAQRRQQQLAKPDHQPLPDDLRQLFPCEFEETEELGWVPKGWCDVALKDIANISSGKRPPSKSDEITETQKIPVWGGNGIKWYTDKVLLGEPFIITGRVGTLGTVYKVFDQAWASDNSLIVEPITENLFDYVFNILVHFDLQSLNSGSTQPLITQTALKSIVVLNPNSSELMTYYQNVVDSFNVKIIQSERESASLYSLRDTLLPKLISGELRLPESLLDSETNPPESAYE
jgi:type I restriction enzyme S subunit